MRKFILIACALSLSGCAATLNRVIPAPATYAQLTKADEEAAITAELGYKAFRIAVETGVKAGFIKGENALTISELDDKLYLALTILEQAYKTGNATQFTAARSDFNALLTTANANLGGTK